MASKISTSKRKKNNVGEDNVVEKELDLMKAKIKTEAEDLVVVHFPQKIIELDKLISSKGFDIRDIEPAGKHLILNVPVPEKKSSPSNKEKKSGGNINPSMCNHCDVRQVLFPEGTVPSNSHIVEILETLKPSILQLIKDVDLIRMWILFLVPQIEDGNNFGVQIQEEALNEVGAVLLDAKGKYDEIALYFITRADLITQVVKYPHCEDYRRGLREYDEKMRLLCCLMLNEIRNHYAVLHDHLTKNIQKIKEPKNSNVMQMY